MKPTLRITKILADHGDEIRSLYKEGKSTEHLGNRFGISAETVRTFLHRVGEEIRSNGNRFGWTEERRQKAIADRQGKPSGSSGKTWKVGRPIQKPNLRGAKNPSWKGGRTPINIAIRVHPDYSRWRTSVFLRDNFTCQACGAYEPRKIQADHMKPLSKILIEFDIRDIDQALRCEQIWDIANGRTLCIPCHKATPTYGRKRIHDRLQTPSKSTEWT